MEIAVLGPGCKNCSALEQATRDALEELELKEEITKITDFGEIASYGVMATPALAVNGNVALNGRVPTVAELVDLIREIDG